MNATYEPDLQPAWLQLGTGLTTDHTYDGQSTLVKKTTGTTSTVYVDDLYEVQGSTVTKYYWFNGERVAMRQGGMLSYLLPDHLGSTLALLDSGGFLVKSERYFPFGKPRQGGVGQGVGAQTDKQFTSQQREGDLYFMKARFYDPLVGRFLQPDSIVPDYANPQSLNRYSYVLNNPLGYTDPTGHYAEGYGEAALQTQCGWNFDTGQQICGTNAQEAQPAQQKVTPTPTANPNYPCPWQPTCPPVTPEPTPVPQRGLLQNIGETIVGPFEDVNWANIPSCWGAQGHALGEFTLKSATEEKYGFRVPFYIDIGLATQEGNEIARECGLAGE